MVPEVEWEAHFGTLDAAELESAHRVPLADRGIAVAAGGRAAAGPRLEHVPDEIAPVARIFALDRDPESPPPAGHRPLSTRHRQCLHYRLDDFVLRMAVA